MRNLWLTLVPVILLCVGCSSTPKQADEPSESAKAAAAETAELNVQENQDQILLDDESTIIGDADDIADDASAKSNFIPPNYRPVVYFDYDRNNIRDDQKPDLNKLVQFLRENSDVHLQIEGHCDERGTDEYNLALGERRSMAVRLYLETMGISTSRMTIISYGEARPEDTRHNNSAWTLNRRAEFAFYR